MKTKHVRPIWVESKDIHSQLEIDTISIGKLSYEAKQYHCKHPQELILISLEDEEIEEGDKFVHHWFNENSTNKDRIVISTADENTNDKKHRKSFIGKVIARQSQISPEYISKFIEQYNKGCIEDLEIEMENKIAIDGHTVIGIEPKLTNGFVTIVEKESISYTEEEVKSLFIKFSPSLTTIAWFNENKKK